jgi:DNA polymerase-3 subunit epsilon/CBS domain-containing protein
MPRVNRHAPLAELSVVVFDTETTGLDVSRDRVVQIGAVRVERGRVCPDETFLALVNPSMPIPPASTAIHGIDDAAVASAPPFAEIHAGIQAFVGDAVVVGQSVGFDLAILLRETRRMGAVWRPPHFLDTKLLYAALGDDREERSLDDLAGLLGIAIAHRHTALDDAMATAEIFVRLLPPLAARGIVTLGDAEAHSNAQTRILERQAREGWYDATFVRPAEAWTDGRDREALAPLDPFLYRHRLRHVMDAPAVFMPPHTTVAEAARRLDSQRRAALIVGDRAAGQGWGIVTERDLLRALARDGGACADRCLEGIMTETVISLPGDAFLYRGLARMQRLGIRHLAVADPAGAIVGMVSARSFLGERANQAIRLGDEVSEAGDPAALARARAQLPSVARELLNQGVDAVDIARVLSFELRELMGRGAVLAEKAMQGEGAGRPPAPYALFVLGSAGRGESLLAAEQDNALVYDSADPEGPVGDWFGRFGEHLGRIVHDSGVAACADGVMVQSPSWRGNLDLWRDRLRGWVSQSEAALAGHADVLLDAHLAYGNPILEADFLTLLGAETGCARALATALAAPAMAPEIPPDPASPDGAETGGRVDLKRYGLFPLTAAARALAVRHGVGAVSTPERVAAVCSLGIITPAVRDRLDEAQTRLKGWLLRQQIDDLDAGRPPTKDVDVTALTGMERRALGDCLARIADLPGILRDGLA